MSSPTLGQGQERLLRHVIRAMPYKLLTRIGEKYEIEVPFGSNMYEIAEFVLDELSDIAKKEIVSIYGDAGNPICYYFSCEPIPDLQTLETNSKAMFYSQEMPYGLHNVPYFTEAEIHEASKSLRLRFYYLKGVHSYFDDRTKSVREIKRLFDAVVVLRPNSSVLEIRAKHFLIAKKVAVGTTRMNIKYLFPLNLRQEKYVKRLLDWIYSLNNARIDLPIRDTRSSITLTARRGRDLRKIKDFHQELERGRLRGGHATIEKEEDYMIRFSFTFNPFHTWFSSFCKDDDIEFVAKALERIVGVYEFESPKKLLDYFE